MRLPNFFSGVQSDPANELPPVEYVRRKRQKYIRIRVKPERVIVSAPAFTSVRQMERFLSEKKSWVLKTLHKIEARSQSEQAVKKFNEGYLLYEGNWTPFTIKPAASAKLAGVSVNGGYIVFMLPVHVDEKEFIRKLYTEFGAGILSQRFNEIAIKTGFVYKRVSVRNQKARWGSCSAKKNINLNWRLIKCPRFVQEYIFIHELCHLIHMNHSKAFWNLVESHYPERKKAEKWLRENGPVVFQEP